MSPSRVETVREKARRESGEWYEANVVMPWLKGCKSGSTDARIADPKDAFTMMNKARRKEIQSGIAGYAHEQRMFLRLLRKRGQFTEGEFDSWFLNRELRFPKRRFKLNGRGICGDSYLLGLGVNGGNLWAEMLELVQCMMALDLIDAKTIKGEVVYSLPSKTKRPYLHIDKTMRQSPQIRPSTR